MAILFLTQGVSPNMELCEQLEKFSNFISHYQIHKECDVIRKDYDFLTIDYKHYNINEPNNVSDNIKKIIIHITMVRTKIKLQYTHTSSAVTLRFSFQPQIV